MEHEKKSDILQPEKLGTEIVRAQLSLAEW